MENNKYIAKWLDGTLTEGERVMFEKTEEFKSLARLSHELSAFRAPEYDVQSEFERLQLKMNSKPSAKEVSLSVSKLMLRIAAALIILTGSYFFFLYNPETAIQTVAAETTAVFLPDSSEVMLNATSRLLFHKKGWSEQRQVSLEGEAFFRVSKGSQFDVATTSGTITVLGTQFNVKARGAYFEVTCYEGSVRVESPLKTVILKPNMMFRVVNGKVDPKVEDSKSSPSWLRKESAFESVPFIEVLKEFERQYGVTISTKNVNVDQLFSGRFTHSDITLALKSISIPLNLTYVIEGNQKSVVLSGEVK